MADCTADLGSIINSEKSHSSATSSRTTRDFGTQVSIPALRTKDSSEKQSLDFPALDSQTLRPPVIAIG